jgi:hypothetical protein
LILSVTGLIAAVAVGFISGLAMPVPGAIGYSDAFAEAGPGFAAGSTGLLAGLATFVTNGILLSVYSAAWNRKLAVLDARRWASEWAVVEPMWSERA